VVVLLTIDIVAQVILLTLKPASLGVCQVAAMPGPVNRLLTAEFRLSTLYPRCFPRRQLTASNSVIDPILLVIPPSVH